MEFNCPLHIPSMHYNNYAVKCMPRLFENGRHLKPHSLTMLQEAYDFEEIIGLKESGWHRRAL
jgi:hypothetical protein